jgi:hypothetical protein
MKRPNRVAVLSTALAGLTLALPAQTSLAQSAEHSPATSSTYYLRAEIFPASYLAVGDALNGGGDGTKNGYAMTANGINNNWATGSYTIDFVVLVFSSQAKAGNVTFKVVSPSNAVAYQYSWGTEQLPKGADWFAVEAKGNYAAPGLYFAEWFLGGSMDGWAPLNFSS